MCVYKCVCINGHLRVVWEYFIVIFMYKFIKVLSYIKEFTNSYVTGKIKKRPMTLSNLILMLRIHKVRFELR